MKLLEEYGIKEDKRFIRAKKEAIYVLIFWVLYTAWCYYWFYVGASTPVEEYTFIWGLPRWMAMALPIYCACPVFCTIVALMIKDCNLSANGKDEVSDVLKK